MIVSALPPLPLPPPLHLLLLQAHLSQIRLPVALIIATPVMCILHSERVIAHKSRLSHNMHAFALCMSLNFFSFINQLSLSSHDSNYLLFLKLRRLFLIIYFLLLSPCFFLLCSYAYASYSSSSYFYRWRSNYLCRLRPTNQTLRLREDR